MVLSENPADYAAAFLGGVGVSFSPCVFPLIPVVIAFIGISANTSRRHGFALSFAYVTGVAVTYSLLGFVASLTGRLFGRISSLPVVSILAGCAFFLFGLVMLEVLTLPSFQLLTVPSFEKKNYATSFLVGLISGFIVGPCTAPALGAILLYLTVRKNLAYGMSVLLCFAYGMGLLLIVAGTFSSLLLKLPRSGRWMAYIKRAGALLLLGVGVWLIVRGIGRMMT